MDAFWEIGLAPWDTAAGTLLIQEAGGHIGTLTGGEYRQGGHIVAGTPKVYAALLELIAPHVPAGSARAMSRAPATPALALPRFPQGACVESSRKIRGFHGVTTVCDQIN